MTAQPAITVTGLGKRYSLGQLHGGYQLLSERLAQGLRGLRRQPRDSFWALRDVDFEVATGETLGIIGHNGAGKSTLLKLLSRVTPPTTGEVTLRGRVGALLEVGTGFHPELTGRENVFLNGAILGMRRAEIAAKFDEIVEFAEVQRFIDTPVKRYSSGMYLRLAFAVAAHLEPDVLIVDEVLSVGDLAFQEKCLGRMEKVAGEGRTVLFVSHNLSAVGNLCPRSILLSGGRKVVEGPTAAVIDRYVDEVRTAGSADLDGRTDRVGSGAVRFHDVHFESAGQLIDSPMSGQELDIVLIYDAPSGVMPRNVTFAVGIETVLGVVMLHLSTKTLGARFDGAPPSGEARCRLPRCPLPAGQYQLTLWADSGGEVLDWIRRATQLTVIEGDFFGTGQMPPESHQSVLVDHEWLVRSVEPADAVR